MSTHLHQRLQAAQPQIEQICRASGIAGASIGVIHEGSTAPTYNRGHSNVGTQTPTTSHTVYGIGSVTKSDPSVTAPLTLTDVLAHHAGLDGSGAMSLAFQGDGAALLPRESLFALVNRFPVRFPPRQGWDCFVWGYALAGAVVERVTGQPHRNYMSAALLRPLGLRETSFRPGSSEPGQLARPYAGLSDGTTVPLHKLQVLEDTFFEASGGLYSSFHDQMARALATLRSIDPDPKEAVSPPPPPPLKEMLCIMSNHAAIASASTTEQSYRLSWVRTRLPGAVGVIGDNNDYWDARETPTLGSEDQPLSMIYHQGSTVGYYTCVALFPDTRSAVVVLTNSIAPSEAADWIARVVIQALFDFGTKQDHVALAEQTNRLALRQYDELADKIAKLRASRPGTAKPPALSGIVGRYTDVSVLFVIDIAHHDKSDKQQLLLVLRFQGLEDQAYDLRYLRDDTFEWSLTHDESKRRGRYHCAVLQYYLFTFEMDEAGEARSLSWANNTRRHPGMQELFRRAGD